MSSQPIPDGPPINCIAQALLDEAARQERDELRKLLKINCANLTTSAEILQKAIDNLPDDPGTQPAESTECCSEEEAVKSLASTVATNANIALMLACDDLLACQATCNP